MKETPLTNKSPPQDDPRIDALVRGYARLSEQVEALTEQIKEQQSQPDKPHKGLTVDDILAELYGKQEESTPSPISQGRAPPESAEEKADSYEELMAQADRFLSHLHQPDPQELSFPAKEPEEADNSPAVREEAGFQKQIRKEPVQTQTPAKRERLQKRAVEEPPSRKKQILKTTGSIVFYCFLVFLVIAALFIRATSSGSPRSLAGFTGMIVLSGSMQSEIPQGSLVIARQVDPETLEIGDDITFMANQTTTVTHRIIGIIEDYEGTGQRAFETQGVMNARPDAQPVPAVNVVGKVIWHSLVLGQIASFIGDYWMFLLFVLVVVIGLAVVLKRIFRKEPKQASRH